MADKEKNVCPIMVAAQNIKDAECLGASCRWWSVRWECCMIETITAILFATNKGWEINA